jgi:hypothetical protein
MLKTAAAVAAVSLIAGSAWATAYTDTIDVDTSSLTVTYNAHDVLTRIAGTLDLGQIYDLAPGDSLIVIADLSSAIPTPVQPVETQVVTATSYGTGDITTTSQLWQYGYGTGEPFTQVGSISLTFDYDAPVGSPDYTVAEIQSISLTPNVPEPATWALMLVGFGAMGAALRRRRAIPA